MAINYIIILSGALNPIHNAHIEMFTNAKQHLESQNNTTTNRVTVVRGYICPSSDKYVKSKLGKWALGLKHRINLANILIDDTENRDWLEVDTSGIASSHTLAQNIYKRNMNKYDNLKVYELCGSDCAIRFELWNKPYRNVICICRNNEYNILHQKITETMNEGGVGNIILTRDEIAGSVSSTKIREVLEGVVSGSTGDNNGDFQNRCQQIVTNKYTTQNSLDYIIKHWDILRDIPMKFP